MTRGQRWHSLQRAKVDKIPWPSLAAHYSQPFPFAYWASARVSTAGAYGCSVSVRFLAANPPLMTVRLFCYVPACYLFAFGLYDLFTAELQVAFTLETKGHQHVQEILRSLSESGFHLITP
jgi:hypothetical protein